MAQNVDNQLQVNLTYLSLTLIIRTGPTIAITLIIMMSNIIISGKRKN